MRRRGVRYRRLGRWGYPWARQFGWMAILAVLLLAFPVSAQRMGDDVPWVNKDYFKAGENADNKELLGNVERNHMGASNFYKHWVRGELGAAIADLRYTLWVFPNHAKALHYLGRLSILSKEPTVAIPYFEKAIEMFPEYAYTRAQFGAYLSDIGQLDAAIEMLDQALVMDAGLAPAHAWLSVAYTRLGKTDLAQKSEARARELGFKGTIDSGAPSVAPPSTTDSGDSVDR